MAGDVQKRLKLSTCVFLVGDGNHPESLSQLAFCTNAKRWRTEGLQMYLAILKDHQPMVAGNIVSSTGIFAIL